MFSMFSVIYEVYAKIYINYLRSLNTNMKRSIVLLVISFFCQSIFTQTTNSVLSSGDWFKFSVDTTGVFKIDKNLLQQIGISTNNLNPKKIQIYGNGGSLLPVLNSDSRFEDLQENAIYIEGEGDGSFDSSDFILFYAKGPHDWDVNVTSETVEHRQNIYSDEAYYFITIGSRDGLRIQQKPTLETNATTLITRFDDYTFFEKEEINIIAAGTQWFFDDNFNIENTQRFKIPFPNAVTNEPISVRLRGVSTSVASSIMDVKVNEEALFSLNLSAVFGDTMARAVEKTASIENSANVIEVTVTYDSRGNPSASAFLDFIEVVGKKQLLANGNQFSFRSFEQATSAETVAYQIQNNPLVFQVWDVSNHLQPQNIQNEESERNFTFKAEGGALKEYVVLSENDYYTPKPLQNGRVSNQNLHALKDINYLVITNSELSSQAQRLAAYHQNNSNLTTKVVILDQIYNEFSSGSKDITGLRDFIKRLYETNSSADKKLQYVCFFGDASYDYKDRIPMNNNIVPVKLSNNSFNLAYSYVTDDFFVMLDPEEGTMRPSHTIDVTSSRIPVSSVSQATEVVDKILTYYQKNTRGDWRNTITFLADDIDVSGDKPLQSGLESIAVEVHNKKPIFNITKIYLDAYVQENSSGGERYPEVKTAITNAIENGTLVFDYFGHGGEDGFASEKILDKPQIQKLNNPKTLPLLITVTCDFSRFDNPNRTTAGELIFWNPNGGAASMVTTTREVFIPTGQKFNEQFIRVLLEFDNEDLTIAESLKETKNQFSSSKQKFFIFYFGDPAMKLSIPKPNVIITKMNGKLVSQPLDTLKALSKVSFEGIVADKNNTILKDFNGSLSTTVFDKSINKTTLDNDGFGVVMPFDTQDSKLFKGNSTVTDGVFKFDFIVPKDIKVAFGKGKLSFYAQNKSSDTDKAGYNADIIVGGIDENAPEDTQGPEIKLYMNDESFIDGGNTNMSPNLIVSLSDVSGINTSITAVDHDIVAVLDGDTTNPIILNNFYQTANDDFTNGKVNYKLRDLAVGPHTIKIKAWDTYNNSSQTTLNFEVISDGLLQLENVLNYPNPFINYTEFWFNHNKPNELLEVQVQVFTVSGKLVKTIHQNVISAETLCRSISWNGLDDFGNKIGKGVYVYKLRVTATDSNLVSEKYEKLVILQ